MTTLRCTFRAPRRPEPDREPVAPPPSPAARMLALAHHVERSIDDGTIESYADAARALGLTRARLTQVMKLLLLSPEIQERLLTGEMRASERKLRRILAKASWVSQRAVIAAT